MDDKSLMRDYAVTRQHHSMTTAKYGESEIWRASSQNIVLVIASKTPCRNDKVVGRHEDAVAIGYRKLLNVPFLFTPSKRQRRRQRLLWACDLLQTSLHSRRTKVVASLLTPNINLTDSSNLDNTALRGHHSSLTL